MQKVLIIEYNGENVISKPWCFEAMCIFAGDDNSGNSEISDMLAVMNVVSYLFEGTQITDDVISKIDTEKKSQLIATIRSWFIDDLIYFKSLRSGEPTKKPDGKGSLYAIYKSMFNAWGILPSEVAKQPPKLLFSLLENDPAEDVDKNDLPADLKVLYGL